jgi:hypothetical protein
VVVEKKGLKGNTTLDDRVNERGLSIEEELMSCCGSCARELTPGAQARRGDDE